MLSLKSRLLAASAICGAAAFVSPAAQAQVSTQFVNAQTGTTYTVLNTDCSKLVTLSNASAVAVTLPQAGTVNKFQQGCFIDFENKGAGTVTITPTTSTVNGGSTLVLTKNQGVRVESDGTNYQVNRGGGIGQGTAACTSTAAALECDAFRGIVTASATAVGQAFMTLAFTNTLVGATSNVLCTINNYTGTLGITSQSGAPLLVDCTPTTSKITARIWNAGTSTQALVGLLSLDFLVVN